MSEEWLAVLIAGALQRGRQRLAPDGSRRARLVRALSARLARGMDGNAERLKRIIPNPFCERLPSWTTRPLAQGGRVLVLKLDHIGDFVLALPALRRLRDGLDDAEITLVCGTWNRALAERSGVADRVVAFDAFSPTSRELAARPDPAVVDVAFAALTSGWGHFDLAVDLRHEPDTRRLLGLVDVGVRAGFAAHGAAGAALDIALANAERVVPNLGNGRPLHATIRLSMLVSAVLAAVRPELSAARCLLSPDTVSPVPGRYAVLVPSAGAPVRVWPTERMAEIGRWLATKYGLQIVLLGGEVEKALTARIAAMLPAGSVTDLAGNTDMKIVPDILASAQLVVGMDTGLTHMATGLGVPTVCVFSGVARQEVWQPTGTNLVALAGRTACSPCYLALPEQCPHAQACLTVIGTKDVMAACEELLADPA